MTSDAAAATECPPVVNKKARDTETPRAALKVVFATEEPGQSRVSG